MRSKKGFIATEIADFIAILLFTIFIVVMYFLIGISSDRINIRITSSFAGEEVSMNLRNIIATPVELEGNIYTMGEMISILGSSPRDSYPEDMKNAIMEQTSKIFEAANLTNAELKIYNADTRILYIRRGFFTSDGYYGNPAYTQLSNYEWIYCKKETSIMYLPRLDNDESLKVEYEECP